MLHNDYMDVLKYFSGDITAKHYGRELSKNVSFSQKKVSYVLRYLEKSGILKSGLIGTIRQYWLNTDNSSIRDYILASEINKKVDFLNRHRKLASVFINDKRIVGIFGSYAKGEQTSSSDMDIFIIGDINGPDYASFEKTFGFNVHLTVFSEKEAETLLKEKNYLVRDIIESHILLFGAERFINLVWLNYYGFRKMVLEEKRWNKNSRT